MKLIILAMLMPILCLLVLSKLAIVGTVLALKLLFVPALFVVTFVFGYEMGRRKPATAATL